MKLRHFTAILLSVVMLFTVLTACDLQASPKDLLLLASANMLSNPYEMNIDINMSSDNEIVNQGVSIFNGNYKAKVDGKNMEMTMSVAGVEVDYVLVDDVIYMDMGGFKVKVPVEGEQAEAIMGDIIGSFDGSADGFGDLENATMTKENGLTTITINGAGDLINGLIGDISDEFDEGVTMTVNPEKTSAVVVLDSSFNYKSMTLNMSLDYGHEEMEEKISVDCVYKYTFDFSNKFTVTAPENADSYMNMDFDAIYGN